MTEKTNKISSFFGQDSIAVGVVGGVGSMAAIVLLLWLGLVIAGEPVEAHIRWFAIGIVPPLLLLRFYVKKRSQPTVVKTLLTIIFVTFVAFMAFLFKGNYLS